MKITVCELPNEPNDLAPAWALLVDHVAQNESDLVLLPEMPFYRWLSRSKEVDLDEWQRAVGAHEEWIARLDELAPATVVSSRPVIESGTPRNVGFIWEPDAGAIDVHAKRYLPDEPGFWEASWYRRGDGDFSIAHTSKAKVPGTLVSMENRAHRSLSVPEQHRRRRRRSGSQVVRRPQ
jgi:N-carbamoylputrescine amidase